MRRLSLFAGFGSLLLTVAPLARAELSASQQLYQQAGDELNAGDYAGAARDFQSYLTQYPSESSAPGARYILGIAQLFGGHPDDALKTFEAVGKDTQADAEMKAGALYYSGQAAFAQAAAAPEAQRNEILDRAIAFLTQYVDQNAQGEERESALFLRAQSRFFHGDFDGVQKDIAQLLAEFPQSNSRADYLYWSGRAYAVQAIGLLEKDRAQAQAVAQRAMEAFRGVGTAKGGSAVAQNDAQLDAANLELALAQDPSEIGQALADYGKVLSRDALVPLQEQLIERLTHEVSAAGQNKALRQSLMDLRQRQQTRLAELKAGADPGVEALIRRADALNRLKRYDEARVVLAYAQPFAAVAPENAQRVSYATIMSYALQGLTAQADAALQKHIAAFPNDPASQNLRFVLGQQLRNEQQYAAAEDQFRKSLAEHPQGKVADQSTLALGAVLQAEKKYPEAEALLTGYLEHNADAPGASEARYNLGLALAADGKADAAVEQMALVAADAKAGPLQADASFRQGYILFQAGKAADAVTHLQKTAADFPKTETAANALYFLGQIEEKQKDAAAARTAYQQVLQDAPAGSAMVPAAGGALVHLDLAAGKLDDAAAGADKLIASAPQSPAAAKAAIDVALAYQKLRNWDGAAARFAFVSQSASPAAAYARAQLAVLWMEAARSLGAYGALNPDERKQWEDATAKAEAAALAAVAAAPAAPETAVAMEELVKLELLRVDSKILTFEQAVAALADLGAKATDPQAKGRFELARIALLVQRGQNAPVADLYAALFQAQPNLVTGPADLARYGDALLAAGRYQDAIPLYTRLGQEFPKDRYAQADSLYGLGAAQLGLGDTAQADVFFDKLEKQAPWSDKIWQARIGRGLAAEKRGDSAKARDYYQAVVMSSAATPETKARGLFGFAHTLETEGKLVENPAAKDQPNAANNYLKIDALFDSATAVAAEGLWRAGQVFEQAKQPEKAKSAYRDLVKKYAQSPFAAQASDRLKALGTAGAPQ